MKKVTASEARQHWFRLLDEVVQGEVIVVQRHGHRLILRREDIRKVSAASKRPAYRRLLRVPHAEQADRWAWEWKGKGRLTSRRASAR